MTKRLLLFLCIFAGFSFAQNAANQPTTCTGAGSISCTPFQPFQQPPYPALAGLRVQIAAGSVNIGALVMAIPAQTITATANATTYIYLNTTTGLINTNGSGFPSSGAYPIATATANATYVYTLADSRPNIFVSGTGGSGGSPGTPTGTVQANCTGVFCAVPNTVVNLSTGNTTYSGLNIATAGAFTFASGLNISDSNSNSITSVAGGMSWADSVGDGCSGTSGTLKCVDGSGDLYEVSDGVFHMITTSGAFVELTGSQFLVNDGTATSLSSTTGVITVAKLVDSALTAGTNPICPNGAGGQFVNTGCNTGAFPSGNQGLRLSNTTGSTTYAATSLAGGIDASVFTSGSIGTCVPGTNDDACIANAIAAIPGNPGSTGGYATIDATGIGNQVWTTNPFASFLSNGTTNITGPKKCGKLLLSGGSNITLNTPITVPRCWDVEVVSRFGQSATIVASSSWPGIYTTGTVTTSSPTLISSGQYQFTVTGIGTAFTNAMLFDEFGICQGSNNPGANGPACGGNGTTTCSATCGGNGVGQLTYGMIIAVNAVAQTLTVATSNSSTGAVISSLTYPSGVNYVIKAPLIWLGAMGADGGDSGGASATWTGGTISCANKPGCTAFTNFSEQENASITHVVIDNVIDTYLDIEGINAVNSGPFDRMVMNASSSCTSATRAIITRIPGSLHPIENTTVNFDGCTSGAGEVAVDFEEGGDLGPGIHFEGNNTSTNIFVDVGENTGGVPMTACPVYCPQQVNVAAGAHIHDLAVTGTGQTGINIGSNAATQIETENNTVSFTNVIVDNARSCSITSATGDSTITRYDHLYGNGWFGTAQNSANSCGSGGNYVGTITLGNIIDTSIATSPSTSPICPNGTGGAFTITGCSGGGGGSTWSGLTNATAGLTLANAGFGSTFNQTSGVAWLWANTTTATSGTTNVSPLHEWAANYWTGSASAQDLWTLQSSLAAGTNGASTLTFTHLGSTGAANVAMPGGLTLGGSTAVCGTAAPAWCGTESALTLTAAATVDGCQMNSTSHAIVCSFNNSPIEPFPLLNGSFTAGHALKVNAQLGGGSAYDIADAGYSATAIPLSDLAAVAANSVIGNFTGGSTTPTATSVSSCSGNNNGTTYTSGTGFTCNANMAQLNVAETFTALQTFGAQASIASTAHGVLLSEGASPVVATATGANGTVFAGNGSGADPAFTANPTVTSLVATGIVDGTAPITITTGTTGNLGSTYSSGYTFNQEATAGTGVTYTLPATVAGKQYCVQNSGTTSVVNAGVLTVYPPASSYVILNGVVNTIGGGGTHGVASGGAAGDTACFVAIDATHWEVFVGKGTWTEN
jgi:hypothetical protein